MLAVVQRVSRASVTVDAVTVGQIEQGLLVLLGVRDDDDEAQVDLLVNKIPHLRIFENDDGKFDRSLIDVGGGMLVVSQFTLIADLKKGRRPSFTRAARPEKAEPLYELFAEKVRALDIPVATGTFGAHMDVSLVNDGPVTLILDTNEL